MTYSFQEKEEKRIYTALDLIKTPRLRLRTLNWAFNWFVNSLVFYGLAWNVGQLAGNLYLNYAINGAIEIPAYIMAVILLAKVGRRHLICWNMVLGGAACLILSFIPSGTYVCTDYTLPFCFLIELF